MSDIKSLILPFFLRHHLFSLSPLFPFFCFRHSATNYQVIQDAEVNNQKKQKIKFSHKEINVIWDGSLF